MTLSMQFESAWHELEKKDATGAFVRVDEFHPAAIYAARSLRGERGLLLICGEQPPELPRLRSLRSEVISENGRWKLFLWLVEPELASLFNQLCNDLLEATRHVPPSEAAPSVAIRLDRWRRLFELGKDKRLSESELRGLVGELLLLRAAFDWCGLPDAVEAWVGPFGAVNDFVFVNSLAEVKTVGPTALRIEINSLDQLAVSMGHPLALVIVRLAAAAIEGTSGFSISSLVSDIAKELQAFPRAGEEFASRLLAVGFEDNAEYELTSFRLYDIRYFWVKDDFPRLLRSDVMSGIFNASYQIEMSALIPFEVANLAAIE